MPDSLRERWQYGRILPTPEAVPGGWSLVKLTEKARLESGHTPSRKHPEYWDGEIPWVSLHDSKVLDRPVIHNTAQTIGELGLANSSARLLPAGTVVFSRTATVGKSTILGREMATSQDFANYVCGPDVHNVFLMQLLRFLQPEWNRLMAGSTHNTIYMPVFENLQVLLPPAGEQRKIAAILSSVDDAIESTQAVIDQLGVVKKAMMAELLTRGLPGRHTRFKQTEIGEVPEEWEVVRAETVFVDGPSNGRSPPSKASPPGVPTFSISAVRNGQVNIASNVKYAEVDPPSVRAALVHRGDILIVRGNGNPELVGLCGMVVEEPPDGCIYPDILMRVRPSPALLPEFLVTLWNSHVVHDQVLDKAKTTNGTYKINGQDVRDILVPLPSASEQQLIGDAVRSVEASGRAHADKLAGLQQLKSALMSVLLTGELRVKPTEEAA